MLYSAWGWIIGGIGAALLFGISGVLQKSGMQRGLALGPYLVAAGLAIAVVGALVWLITRDHRMSAPGLTSAVAFGVVWALGTLAVAIALQRYQTPISQLVPLYNMNTLVAVLLGLVVFGEAADVRVGQLCLGAACIVAGGVLCARA